MDINTKKIEMHVPYFQAPNAIFDIGLKSQELVVYLYLARCGNHGGQAFPSYNTIAKKCGIARRTAIMAVQSLIEKGLVVRSERRRTDGGFSSNIYEVVAPQSPAANHTEDTPSASHALGSAPGASYKEPYKKNQENHNNNHNAAKETAPLRVCSSINEEIPANPCIPMDSSRSRLSTSGEHMSANLRMETQPNEETREAIRFYFRCYEEVMGKKHPYLKPAQLRCITEKLNAFDYEHSPGIDGWREMICCHFERNMRTDWNINHFASEGVLLNTYHRSGC